MNTTIAALVWLLSLSVAARQPGTAAESRRATGEIADNVRVVVTAIRVEAERNSRLCPMARLGGDALTELYVRSAAAAAQRLPPEQAVAGFLIGLGVGLDDSLILRKNPLTAGLCQRAESDEERRRRLTVLGSPTMRGHRDLCQHFAVSCALTEIVGAKLAEAAGLFKEQRDSQGGSGFSFIDLMADLSGIDLALRLKQGEFTLRMLETAFRTEEFLPDSRGLKEDLQMADFAREFGSISDRRFLDVMKDIRERIHQLPRGRGSPPGTSRRRLQPPFLWERRLQPLPEPSPVLPAHPRRWRVPCRRPFNG